jgi:aspartate-semialdehyde dehydrogenase
MLALLRRQGFAAEEITLFASPRSAGREVDGLPVHVLDEDAEPGAFEVAILSAGGGVSRAWAPRFAAAGAVVVDNSSAWRMDPDVPLVVSEVNPDALERIPKGIVANPNCTTMVAMLPLKALHDAFGLRALVATSCQAAGGAGQKGMDELRAQVHPLLARGAQLADDGARAVDAVAHRVHADTLAFNVVPWLGAEADDGYSDEELKLVHESRKILALPELAVTPTCVRVPVMVGHAVAVRATFARPVDLDAARAALAAFPNLVLDERPTPLRWAGRDEVAVGRLRRDLADPEHGLAFFVVGDNLLKGAALNTVQLAELLYARGLAGHADTRAPKGVAAAA